MPLQRLFLAPHTIALLGCKVASFNFHESLQQLSQQGILQCHAYTLR